VFFGFYVAALCNLGFTICGSYIEQVWPPLVYSKQGATQEFETFSTGTTEMQWRIKGGAGWAAARVPQHLGGPNP